MDEFFSKLEAQRVDGQIVHKEKEALKKLDNVKKDHQKRLDELQSAQVRLETSVHYYLLIFFFRMKMNEKHI